MSDVRHSVRPGLILFVEYSITAQFTEGDPAYEWIILFLVSILFLCMRLSRLTSL